MLKTKVKASSVTNLTDARYFAAWEAEWLGFNFDTGSDSYIQPQVMKAIKEWVDGVKIVGEFNLQSAEEIRDAADLLELDAVQLGMLADKATFHSLHASEVPIIAEMVLESPDSLDGLAPRMGKLAPFVEAFLLNFDKNSIGWESLQGKPLEQLQALCRKYRIILSLDFNTTTLREAMDILPITGINVQGGEEEKVGYKSFDELDSLFEALEDPQ